MTVHVFNPRVPEQDILTFLTRFVDVQSVGQKVTDGLNIWTCKRRYLVRLRSNSLEEDGVSHPPAYFSIGPSRGYLFYPGQPLTCKKCFQRGHKAVDCTRAFCRKCKAADHETANCGKLSTCNLCGSMDHVYRSCPRKQKSFAAIVK
uniref:CCHC-type domain-containing protein n=1 Tax=Lepisosteus oculatus TaxID=7918 RepID=W5LWX5_LEPOC